MAVRHRNVRRARYAAEHRDMQGCRCVFQHVRVAGAADPVEDHACHRNVFPETGETMHRGRRALRLRAGIYHQDYRQAECSGNIGG